MTNLEAVIRYWGMTRRIGHSYAVLVGVDNIQGKAIYVTMDHDVAKELQRRKPNIIIMRPSDCLEKTFMGYAVPLVIDHYAMEVLVKSHTKEVISRTEKAYGACHNCYGKGYATVNDQWMGIDTDTDIGSRGGIVRGGKTNAMKFCTCERGKQLKEFWENK